VNVFQSIFACITGLDWMSVSLALFVLWAIYILWRVQRTTNHVDFRDWWVGKDGKAEWSKAAAILGFAIVSWVVVYVTVHEKVPDGLAWILLIYLAACVGSPVAFAIINLRQGNPMPQPPQPQVTTVTNTAGATVTTTTQPPPS
jgi:hypothetical protein